MDASFAVELTSGVPDWSLAVLTLALSVVFAVAAGVTIGLGSVLLAELFGIR
ncbi:hypothetical protein [Haloferax sulfurifontis]|uniref:Uncharacterized protein n=1 Tax=Haloferax sulfurifontis TaxID=255616 RepID=A0A830EBE8_9EURY|nr:hypothetical protein [Haloferax sulfurifontis]GGC72189.1 hypothetical protein GCM10007209_37650 [Haloferax sulfurifontis]